MTILLSYWLVGFVPALLLAWKLEALDRRMLVFCALFAFLVPIMCLALLAQAAVLREQWLLDLVRFRRARE